MAEVRVSEPKVSKCGTYSVRKVKHENKVLGTIETQKAKPGERTPGIFWAVEGVLFVSNRDATIYVSRPAVANLRTYGVGFIGLKFTDGTSYSTPLDTLTDPRVKLAKTIRPLYAVPLDMWTETLPPEDDRVARTLAKMRVPGGRAGKSTVTGQSK